MSYQGCSSIIHYKPVTHHETEYILKNEVFYKEFAEKVLIENLIFCPVIYPFDNFRIILEKPEVVLLLT